MPVASEDSEAEFIREKAEYDAREAVQELAANLMRMVGGTGKPYEVESQAAKLLVAYRAYREAAPGHPVSNTLADALDLTKDPTATNLSAEQEERRHGEGLILVGALRMAAAKLLEQNVQVANGHSLMFDGIKIIEERRARNRAAPQARVSQPKRAKPRASRQSKP